MERICKGYKSLRTKMRLIIQTKKGNRTKIIEREENCIAQSTKKRT